MRTNLPLKGTSYEDVCQAVGNRKLKLESAIVEKMDNIVHLAVIRYLGIKGLSPKEIQEDMVSKLKKCTFWEYRDFTIVYRKYVNLYFVSGITNDENELAVLELMHNLLETLNVYFSKVSELDIVHNIDRVHVIIQEMFNSGFAIETSKEEALAPLRLLDAVKR